MIGIINTLVDFAIYLAVLHALDNILVANIIATSTALVVSFILNSKFTFQLRSLSLARFAGFLGVTLFGLWILQTGIIYALTPLVSHVPSALFAIFGTFALQVEQLVPKLMATVVTLVWNYAWYSRVIFKKT